MNIFRKIIEEYRRADSIKRNIMWIRFIELRGIFGEIDSDAAFAR